MSLTLHGRREAEIDKAFPESNVRLVINLVGYYGLSANDRCMLRDEPDRRAVTTLAGPAQARGVADVWRLAGKASGTHLPRTWLNAGPTTPCGEP